MKTTTNENMIPKWIADIFKTRKEKRSEQEQLDLDRYVADLRFTDPEKYERLQGILKHVDPDTGHLPTGLNTGNIDESVFDDIKVAGFKTWRYTDPVGQVFYAKGRDAGEAARYLRLKYKLKDIDVSQIINTEKGVGYIDDTVVSIYNRDYEPMDEMKNKLKSTVKELMADLPPTGVHAVAAKDEIKNAINSMDKNQLINLSGYLSNKSGFQPKVKTVEDLRNELLNSLDLVSRYFEVRGGELAVKGSTPSTKQDVAYTGPGMKENKTKMNKKDLMEMIREVIAEEAGKVDVVLPGEGVIASVTPEQKEQLNGKGFTKKELKAFGIDHEAIRDDIRYKVSGDKSLQLTSILNYIPDNPYSHKKVTENKTNMKVNQLRQIIREEISKVLNEQTNRIGWDKGFQTSIEFNADLAQLLAPYLERGTITKDELEMAADQAGSEGYGEWDRIIGSKSEGPYTIKMFNGSIQISGTKGRDISKNMQSSFDKYGTSLGGK